MTFVREKKFPLPFLAAAAGAAAALFFLEGLLGFGGFLRDIALSDVAQDPSHAHTRHDSDIGWTGKPNVLIKDHYGPGIDVRTDDWGHRASSAKANGGSGKRILCSGDSFTFGFGVNGLETWCALLGEDGTGASVMNLAQNGWGADQMYLYFKREVSKIPHDLHIFAVIRADIDRMRLAEFINYPKPVVTSENGAIRVKNTPIPEGPYRRPWLTEHRDIIGRLHMGRLLLSLSERLSIPPDDAQTKTAAWETFGLILKDLKTRSPRFRLVYLPVWADLNSSINDSFRERLKKEAKDAGVDFTDLTEEFKRVPKWEQKDLFFFEDPIYGQEAAGHYTPKGHTLAADLLSGVYKKL